MDDALNDILMWCQNDLNELINLRRYLKNTSDMNIIVSCQTIKKVANIVMKIHSLEHPDADYMDIILDLLLFFMHNKKNEFGGIGIELGNLTLKILTSIERDRKFHILFCKLLSFISLMTERKINVWQHLAHPLLNIFIYKKFEHVYLEKALTEFRNISINANPSELVNFTKQNLHILRGFSMLLRCYGDFVIQMNILELVFLFVGNDTSQIKGFFCCGNQEMMELLEKMNFNDFRKDARIFLNALNKSLGSRKRVFSINCSIFYLGSALLSPPVGVDGIWVDVNRDGKRISVSCADYRARSENPDWSILQIPATDVEKIKLEFDTLDGMDCYCIVMNIKKMPNIRHFTNGSEVMCTALTSRHPQQVVFDFIEAVEELSEKIQEYKMSITTDVSGSCDSAMQNSRTGHAKLPTQKSTVKISNTSTFIFTTENKRTSLDQSFQSSILPLKNEHDESIEPRQRYEEKYNRTEITGDPNLEVNQISSRGLEYRKSSLDSSINSSWSSSHISTFQVSQHTSGCENKINCKFSPQIQKKLNLSDCRNKASVADPESKLPKKNYSVKLYEEWASSFEDFIPTQEFKLQETDKENIPNNFPAKPQKKPNKKSKLEKSDAIQTASLLDPNGYSYRRWQLQTTSKRSNFWLEKLKETQKKFSKPVKDVFHFSEEDELSDGSNVFFKNKKIKPKKINLKIKNGYKKGAGINKKEAKVNKMKFEQKKNKATEKNKINSKVSDVGDIRETLSAVSGNLTINKRTSEDKLDSEGKNSKRKNCKNKESLKAKTLKVRNSKTASDLKQEMSKIESEISKRMSQFMQEVHQQEREELRMYLKLVQESMQRISEGEENILRFQSYEKLVEYCNLFCSLSKMNEKSEQDVERLRNGLKIFNKPDKRKEAECKINQLMQFGLDNGKLDR